MNMIILDDHPLVRKGICTIVSSGQFMNIVGEAANTTEALRLLDQTNPDLVLVDLNLGNENGIDFIQEARRAGHACKYIILTSSITQSELQLAQSMQIEGVCLKEAFPEDLLYGIEVVARGRKYYDPVLMGSIMEHKSGREKQELSELTPKELEVLMSLGKGRSNKEIANALYITEFTVKKHVSQVLAKLELADRTQAALYALSKGLVQFEMQR
ncbi:response regulator transcription factor [Paenibacillus sp. CGMCC 1.16610]|uniref:Response regulator transcription factor n=2 Tax=Paenibacillus TaxID=44249 RepID=A0ABU6DM21_9BACL|nr:MULTISPECIES: response regulator transcription factor [Paenibacillus]MBA2942866.1 response regulator transcription factor [Paenibacillus sp. CGMCC 1.16610]MCY9663185.1 response regulator transcription factor [Paenibacillus anseongense]MEB4798838.1 response regulator transcription factor [Paenibacillus chondroitinus]MVQ38351.1 response regulator [Paenibacillus anseongense]